ncbi:23S rRNA (uracil(1939)-C(5))-methyltransferase RlmD [Halomonadaceae bacterium LMG 33818]|uniref:23S rRNA (uracil(1939)-C(5))-methyltransferase RlmD n=1 Tax=Cernens ardua TaxID=3402176 RepID=UPI003EDBC42D
MALGKRRPPRRPAQDRQARETKDRQIPSDHAAVESNISSNNDILEVLRLSHDGRGVARQSDGKTVFIDQALPGEKVRIKIHRQRSRYNEAHVAEWLSTSPDRVEPQCQHFHQCGGCRLQHMDIRAQRTFKQHVLGEHLEREGLSAERIGILSDAPYGYRRRARLGVKVDSQGDVHFGFRREGSDRLFDIVECPILVPALHALLAPIRTLLQSLEIPKNVGHIELIAADSYAPENVDNAPDADGVTVHDASVHGEKAGCAVLVIRQIRPHAQDEAQWQAFADAWHIMLVFDRGNSSTHVKEVFYRVSLGESKTLPIGFRPGDFIQVNGEVNQHLINTVLDWSGSQADLNVLDLFAGVGNFTLPLAERGWHVHAIEGSEGMVRQLQVNAQRLKLDIRADAQDLAKAPSFEKVELVLLDPPRGGAHAVVKSFGTASPSRLIYVSCDPTTLARDAAVLTDKGYRLKHINMVDMFPQTAHMESISLFERN